MFKQEVQLFRCCSAVEGLGVRREGWHPQGGVDWPGYGEGDKAQRSFGAWTLELWSEGQKSLKLYRTHKGKTPTSCFMFSEPDFFSWWKICLNHVAVKRNVALGTFLCKRDFKTNIPVAVGQLQNPADNIDLPVDTHFYCKMCVGGIMFPVISPNNYSYIGFWNVGKVGKFRTLCARVSVSGKTSVSDKSAGGWRKFVLFFTTHRATTLGVDSLCWSFTGNDWSGGLQLWTPIFFEVDCL